MFRVFVNRSFFSLSKFEQYIRIMQLTNTSTVKDLKPKYIQLVKRYHPDNGEIKDATYFKSIVEAYKYLSIQQNWPKPKVTHPKEQKTQTKKQHKKQKTQKVFPSYFEQKKQNNQQNQYVKAPNEVYEALNKFPQWKAFILSMLGIGVIIAMIIYSGRNKNTVYNKDDLIDKYHLKKDQKEKKRKERKQKKYSQDKKQKDKKRKRFQQNDQMSQDGIQS